MALIALRVTRRCSPASRARSPAPARVPRSLGPSPAAPCLLEVGSRDLGVDLFPGSDQPAGDDVIIGAPGNDNSTGDHRSVIRDDVNGNSGDDLFIGGPGDDFFLRIALPSPARSAAAPATT